MSHFITIISRVGGITLAVTLTQHFSRRYKPSLCNQDNSISTKLSNNIKTLDKNAIEASALGDDEIWEKKKNTCGFCRSFLESPCAYHFKRWSKCVDLAKDLELDYVEECAEYTSKLFKCTDEHKDYFESLSTPESSSVSEESTDDPTQSTE